MRQGRGQRVRRPVGPEQRDRDEHAIVGAEVHPLADVEAVLDQRAVLQRHRLRARAGARRVEHERVVLTRDLGRAQRGRAAVDQPAGRDRPRTLLVADDHDLAQLRKALGCRPGRRQAGQQLKQRRVVVAAAEAIDADEHLGLRVGQHVLQVPGLGERVERRDACAEPVRAERRAEPFGAVRAEQPERPAAREPEVAQPARPRVDALVELAVGQREIPVDHRSGARASAAPARRRAPRAGG